MRFLAFVVLLAASCTRVVVATPELDVGVASALQHTVRMSEGCTAVNIGEGWVLTAKHCTDDNNLGDEMSVGTLVFQGETDFAVLYNENRATDPTYCLRAPRFGEHVYAVGYPMQRETKKQALTVTDGVISTVRPSPDGEIRTSAPLFFGNSGGGLWAEDGCLLGVTVAAFMDTAENYIVPVDSIPYGF